MLFMVCYVYFCSQQFIQFTDLVAVHCTHGLNRTGYLVCRCVCVCVCVFIRVRVCVWYVYNYVHVCI